MYNHIDMKSQTIRIRNLPPVQGKRHFIRVKPAGFLLGCAIAGILMTFDNTSAAGVGICITLLCLFAELMLPDRLLAEFTDDYLVLFNTRERDSCSLIYWDEIVNWQYEYHSYADTLVILLVDGSEQTADMYSKKSAARWFNQYIPGKETKNIRVSREGE